MTRSRPIAPDRARQSLRASIALSLATITSVAATSCAVAAESERGAGDVEAHLLFGAGLAGATVARVGYAF